MERTVRVDLPTGSPEGTLKLCKKIVAKHTALGVSSPLTGFVNMTTFEAKRADAKTKHDLGDSRSEDSEALHGQALKKAGIAKGQNKQSTKTVYWYVLQIRDVLLIKNKGEEENLEQWGFNVVITQTGGRRNVRVDIPRDNPDTLTELAEDIVEKHTALGVGSPLIDNVDMADFEPKVTATRAAVDAAETANAESQEAFGQALVVLGYAEGQTSETEGTLYYDICIIRDRLLQVNQDEEDNLEPWGFKVIIDSSPAESGGGGGGGGIVRQGPIPMSGIIAIDTTGITISPTTQLILEAFGSTMRFYFAATAGAIPLVPWAENNAGQTSTVTAADIGLSPSRLVLHVQNAGVVDGGYKITIMA